MSSIDSSFQTIFFRVFRPFNRRDIVEMADELFLSLLLISKPFYLLPPFLYEKAL